MNPKTQRARDRFAKAVNEQREIQAAINAARKEGYHAGAADVEARIDAAIKKQWPKSTRERVAKTLRKMATDAILGTYERVLLDILDPETKP